MSGNEPLEPMCQISDQLLVCRFAFRVSLVTFVVAIVFGALNCWYARAIAGWEGLGMGLNTLIGCGLALAFNFFFALVAAWKIKEARWLVLAHVPLLALIAWLLSS